MASFHLSYRLRHEDASESFGIQITKGTEKLVNIDFECFFENRNVVFLCQLKHWP